jgi:hypothetical protein
MQPISVLHEVCIRSFAFYSVGQNFLIPIKALSVVLFRGIAAHELRQQCAPFHFTITLIIHGTEIVCL